MSKKCPIKILTTQQSILKATGIGASSSAIFLTTHYSLR